MYTHEFIYIHTIHTYMIVFYVDTGRKISYCRAINSNAQGKHLLMYICWG